MDEDLSIENIRYNSNLLVEKLCFFKQLQFFDKDNEVKLFFSFIFDLLEMFGSSTFNKGLQTINLQYIVKVFPCGIDDVENYLKKKVKTNFLLEDILFFLSSFQFFPLGTVESTENNFIFDFDFDLRMLKSNQLISSGITFVVCPGFISKNNDIVFSISFILNKPCLGLFGLDVIKFFFKKIKQSIFFQDSLELSNLFSKEPLIKSSIHLESQKFGKKPHFLSDFSESYKDSKIEVIGLDFLPSHYHALNAIQKLLTATNYRGNIAGIYLSKENNTFKFEGKIPRIKFSKSEYLYAYGVRRYVTARGKNEFGGKESKEALDALYYLGAQPHLIVATRRWWKDGEELVDRYQTLSPILRICEGWKGLTTTENNKLDEGYEFEFFNSKHKGFVVEPCPILVDQIDSYFVLKPANTYQELKLKFPNASKFAYTFIDWIVKEATIKKLQKVNKLKKWPKKIEIGQQTLAYILRMDSYIKSRNWKKIDIAIKRCVEIAISLSWLLKHETVEGKIVEKKEVFFLNQLKFEQISKEKKIID